MMTNSQKMAALTAGLVREGVLRNQRTIEVFKSIERADFVPETLPEKYKYEDSPFPIGYNVTISAPHMHCYALEYMHDKLLSAKRALDVGSGTGYLTLAMAMMMASNSVA